MTKPRGYVIYRGPSLIDGAPIVAIAITKSSNRKTGNMLQTYIIRADMDPRDANRTGADFSICGSCPHRGIAEKPVRRRRMTAGQGSAFSKKTTRKLAKNRSCYVQMGQGPLGVYRSLISGKYPDATNHRAIAALGKGRMIRLGTYGDPAAVPDYIWQSLLSEKAGHTAYSHQSGMAGANFNPATMMLSADSESAARAAWAQGARTFRVLRVGEQPVKGSEIDCPSSRGVHCVSCGLCAGASIKAKSITIPAHGGGAVHIH